eukprot:5584294-Pyramimonas_sp.AAC.1
MDAAHISKRRYYPACALQHSRHHPPLHGRWPPVAYTRALCTVSAEPHTSMPDTATYGPRATAQAPRPVTA